MAVMKILKQFLLIMVAVVGLTFGVSAQKGGGQQRPPKNPPKIEPAPKPTPKSTPKKPGYAFVIAKTEEDQFAE